MPEGAIFDVIGGPFCLEADTGNDIRWYQVRYNGMTGWSPEASNGTYFLEPYGGSGGSSESNLGGSNQCSNSWSPPAMSEGQDIWLRYSDYQAGVNSLIHLEDVHLSRLASFVWWRELLEEGGQELLTRGIEHFISRAAGFGVSLALDVQSVANNFSFGSAQSARIAYENTRSDREVLQLYDRERNRCGNWIRIPLSAWSAVNSAESPEAWWNLLSNFLPADARRTCVNYPETCPIIFGWQGSW